MEHTNRQRQLTLEDIQSVIDPSLTEVVDWLMAQEIWIDQMITCQFLVKAAIEVSPIKSWYYEQCRGMGIVHGVQRIRAMKPEKVREAGGPPWAHQWAVDTLSACKKMREGKEILRSIELGIMYAYRKLPPSYWLGKIEKMGEWLSIRVASIVWWRMFAHVEVSQRIDGFDKYVNRYVPVSVEPNDDELMAALISIGFPKNDAAKIAKCKEGRKRNVPTTVDETEQEEGDEAEDDSLADSWAQSAIC